MRLPGRLGMGVDLFLIRDRPFGFLVGAGADLKLDFLDKVKAFWEFKILNFNIFFLFFIFFWGGGWGGFRK